jgi:hypothetical protein
VIGIRNGTGDKTTGRDDMEPNQGKTTADKGTPAKVPAKVKAKVDKAAKAAALKKLKGV